MKLKDQTVAIIGIILDPKRTLISLPSNQFCVMSLITALLLLLPNFFIIITVESAQVSQVIARIAPQIMWFIFFFFAFAYILKFIAKLIHRPVTLIKAMNIIGYCQAPRVLLLIIVSIVAWMTPSVQEPGAINTILNAVVYLATLYSLALIVFGVNWSFLAMTSEKE